MIEIRDLQQSDTKIMAGEFAAHHWPKPIEIFQKYLSEQRLGERLAWVGYYNNQFVGYVTLKWQSFYQPFYLQNIPEIMDLNVLPPYRNQGIGTILLKCAEEFSFKKSPIVGLGVGLYADYGNAQKLYIKNGYIPDGGGITHHYTSVKPGSTVPVDDDLVLWFTKKQP